MELTISTLPAKNDLFSYLSLAQKQGINNVQFDVIDGRFVADKTITPKDIKLVQSAFKGLKFDVHLMVNRPLAYVKRIKDIKIEEIVFQIEAVKNPLKTLEKMKNLLPNTKVGIAVNLPSKINEIIDEIFNNCAAVLIMSVPAGKSGQAFSEEALEKVKYLKKNFPNIKVILDGGINDKNISKIKKEKVDEICLGSFAYKLITNNEGGKLFSLTKPL